MVLAWVFFLVVGFSGGADVVNNTDVAGYVANE